MKILKKIACSLLVFSMVLVSGVLVACGKSKDDNQPSNDKIEGTSIVISVAEANEILERSGDSMTTEFSKTELLTLINRVKSNMLSATAVSYSGKYHTYNENNRVDSAVVTNDVEYRLQTTDNYTREGWMIENSDVPAEDGCVSIIDYEIYTEGDTTTYTKSQSQYETDYGVGVAGFLYGKFTFMLEQDGLTLNESNIDKVTIKDGYLHIQLSASLNEEDINEVFTIENGYIASNRLVFTDEGRTMDYRATYTWNNDVDLTRANTIPNENWVEE